MKLKSESEKYTLLLEGHGYELLGIGRNQSHYKLFGRIGVHTNVVYKRTRLQLRFHFAWRDVFAVLQLDKVLLPINNLTGIIAIIVNHFYLFLYLLKN